MERVQHIYQEYPDKWWQRAIVGHGRMICGFLSVSLCIFSCILVAVVGWFSANAITALQFFLIVLTPILAETLYKLTKKTFGYRSKRSNFLLVAFPSDSTAPLVIGKALWVWKKSYDRFVEIDVENLDKHIPKKIYWTLKVSALNGLVQARIPITLTVRLKESSRLLNPLEAVALLAYFRDCSYVRSVFKCDLESICSDSGFLKGTGVSIERFFASTTAMTALDVRTWILEWIKQNVEKFVFSSIVNMEVSVGDPQIVVTSSIS